MTVTLYTTPTCVQCTATKRALDQNKITYETVDLTEDAEAMKMVQALGHRHAPVVIAGDDHWSGFRPDLIKTLCCDA